MADGDTLCSSASIVSMGLRIDGLFYRYRAPSTSLKSIFAQSKLKIRITSESALSIKTHQEVSAITFSFSPTLPGDCTCLTILIVMMDCWDLLNSAQDNQQFVEFAQYREASEFKYIRSSGPQMS